MRFTFSPDRCPLHIHARMVRRRSRLNLPLWAWEALVAVGWA